MKHLLPLLISLSLSAQAQEAQFDSRHFVEYQTGTLPLILGSPHGGKFRTDKIKDRTYGVVDSDVNTQDLTRRIHAHLITKTGGAPFMIISLLHRAELDPNREIIEAAQGDDIGIETHKTYHGFIVKAAEAVKSKFPAGLYIDIHGQRHKEKRVELGYTISPEKLRLPDEQLEAGTLMIRQSSIRDLDQRSPASFPELLRGKTSLGGLLGERGYICVPSPQVSAPAKGELYFMGGYTVDRHGSRNGGSLNAIQIECPFDGVRDTEANREKFAITLAEVLPEFFKTHFRIEMAPVK